MNTLTMVTLTSYELVGDGLRLTIEPSADGTSYAARGTFNGEIIEYSEYGFRDLEGILKSLRLRPLCFFAGVNIPEMMEVQELEDFGGIEENRQ